MHKNWVGVDEGKQSNVRVSVQVKDFCSLIY